MGLAISAYKSYGATADAYEKMLEQAALHSDRLGIFLHSTFLTALYCSYLPFSLQDLHCVNVNYKPGLRKEFSILKRCHFA